MEEKKIRPIIISLEENEIEKNISNNIFANIVPLEHSEGKVRTGELYGKRVLILGAGLIGENAAMHIKALELAEMHKTEIIVGDFKKIESFSLIPPTIHNSKLIELMANMPLPTIHDPNTPNKLAMLRNLRLSPEQIEYFTNSPSFRMEGESFEDYKNRRMLNKLLIKYRGQL